MSKSVFSEKGIWQKAVITIVGLGVVSMLFSRYPAQSGNEWYHTLNQPFFAPAYWMPFVMWTLVYILIGFSFAVIWHKHQTTTNFKEKETARSAMILFGIHLVFNVINPLILIGLHWPKVALADMIILIVFIIILIKQFSKISTFASRLLIPYLIWILYATALIIGILVLN